MVADSIMFGRDDFAGLTAEGSKVVDRYAVIAPGDDGTAANGRFMLGVSLTRTGHAAEGETLLRKALAQHDDTDAIYTYVYGNVETALGDCLLAQKRYSEAEPPLLTGYKMLQERSDPPAELVEAASQRLHDLYIAWNKPAQAARFAGKGAVSPSAQVP